MSPRTGQPKDIAKVERDKDARAWNVVMNPDGHTLVTFAALDREHATDLAAHLNACAWVTVENSKAGDA